MTESNFERINNPDMDSVLFVLRDMRTGRIHVPFKHTLEQCLPKRRRNPDIHQNRCTTNALHALRELVPEYIDSKTSRYITPIPMGSEVGPIAAILCGGPGSYMPACDNTNPAAVPKTIVNQVYDGVGATATDVRNLIREVRIDPSLYYIEVLTTSIPASPGAVRAPLQGTCGTP